MCKYCFENEYTRFKNEELSNETDIKNIIAFIYQGFRVCGRNKIFERDFQ